MRSRARNLSIIALMLLLLGAAAYIINERRTVLGLDLRGGVELVYEGRPTPQVPEVTPQAVDDAIETIRKRTDALGVSEPEIQRSGANQIQVGLPDVKNADRAIQQVGTTAQLQFYDWEPNVLGERGPDQPYSGSKALFQAVSEASNQKPKVERTDVEPGSDESRKRADKTNDSSKEKFYLFGPDQKLIAGPDSTCEELLSEYEPTRDGPKRKVPEGSECKDQLAGLRGNNPPQNSQVLKVPRGIVVVEGERAPNQPESIKRYFVLEDDSELSGSDIKNPEQNFDQQTNEPIVTMEFTDKGREAFARVTKRIAERGSEVILPPGTDREAALQRFAITLDNQIVSLATIDFRENPEGIDGRTGAQINGIGNISETQDLSESLRIGALPIELKLISQTQVSASLGQQALDQGLLASGAGLALTILFLLVFYRVLGGIAALTLVIYAILLFALVKLIPITLTLPGIAGMVLTLAVAADANIVIFERIKEEVRTGRTVAASIASGYGKALRTIIDANVVTIGVAFVLFTLATGGVKGFAFTLGVGTIVSLFTAVLATSAILGSLSRSRLLRSRHMLGVGTEKPPRRFDFSGASRWFFSASGLILVVGALGIAGLGINLGIDFESGTRIKTPIQQDASVDQIRETLSPLGYGDAEVQEVEEPELGRNVIQISTPSLEPEQVERVRAALDEDFGVERGDFSANSIGPTFGKQIANTAVIAVIASLLLISLYIGLRFEWKVAVPVLIALFHDILITSGTYALTDREITTSTIAALLTIMGYSLYDTIIVFDRIRENVPRMPRATFTQIANRSMSEVLTRSLATSVSALFPVSALLLFGGETLQDFAFALTVGMLSGAYSSIFIATPIMTHWKEREPVYRRRRRMVMEENDGVVPPYATGTLADEEDAAAAAAAENQERRRLPRRKRRTPTATPATAGGPSPAVADTPRPKPSGAARTPAADMPGDGAAEPPKPRPARKKQPAPAGKGGRGADADGGDGDGDTAPDRSPDGGDGRAAGPRVSSTGGAGKPKTKRSGNRGRKKHGRR